MEIYRLVPGGYELAAQLDSSQSLSSPLFPGFALSLSDLPSRFLPFNFASSPQNSVMRRKFGGALCLAESRLDGQQFADVVQGEQTHKAPS